jgi:hypothetical protein
MPTSTSGEIVCKDHVQVSHQWYDLQVQVNQCRNVGCYVKIQDSKAAKKIKGSVPDLLVPEARSGMAKKHTQSDANAEHHSNKRRCSETETREGTPVSVRGTPSERDGAKTPLFPFTSSLSFGGSVTGDKTPHYSPKETILVAINKQVDVEVEKEHMEKELKEKEFMEKESSKMSVD